MKIGDNFWAFEEIKKVNTILTCGKEINLISPIAIFKIWRKEGEEYTRGTALRIIKKIISKDWSKG